MSKPAFCALILTSLILALAFRLARLDARPVHHDEANQALKFGALLETGEYRYDRNDHHGPTLYYLTLPVAWARGQRTLAALDETTLRIVPALFGAGCVVLFCLLAGGLGRKAIACAALFAAVSPSLCYYSRFYIQESLFVFFSLGFLIALGRYALSPNPVWALAAGVCAGLSFATKETSVLIFAAAVLALSLTRVWSRSSRRAAVTVVEQHGSGWIHFLIAAGTGMATAFVLYTSFFRNQRGIFESFAAFADYVMRGIDPGLHANPWYFYLKILGFSSSAGFVWTEGFILVLALIGARAAFGRAPVSRGPRRSDPAVIQFWLRYILSYSLLTAFAFSAIRYKTPWNLLTFHIGFVILAGSGVSALLHRFRSPLSRAMVILVVLSGCVHLGVQNLRANFQLPADPRNPYVYAQTSPDFLRLSKRIHNLALVHPDGPGMLVKVIAGPYEQWPLPWYLRDLSRVGYWTSTEAAGSLTGIPVIIASPQNLESTEKFLGDRCELEFYGLRPGILLALFIDRPLWNAYLARR